MLQISRGFFDDENPIYCCCRGLGFNFARQQSKNRRRFASIFPRVAPKFRWTVFTSLSFYIPSQYFQITLFPQSSLLSDLLSRKHQDKKWTLIKYCLVMLVENKTFCVKIKNWLFEVQISKVLDSVDVKNGFELRVLFS